MLYKSVSRILICMLAAVMVLTFITPESYAARKVKKITLSSIRTIRKGHSKTFKVKFSPSNATNKKLKWKSSNSKIAKVSSKGKVIKSLSKP